MTTIEQNIPNDQSSVEVKTRWSRPTRYVVGIAFVLFCLVLFYLSRGVLFAIVGGGVIAFLVRPIIRKLHTGFKMRWGCAVLLTYLLVVLVILLIPILLIPSIVNSLGTVLQVNWAAKVNDGLSQLETTLQVVQDTDLPPIIDETIDDAIGPMIQLLNDTGGVTLPEPPAPDAILNFVAGALTASFGVVVSVVSSIVSGTLSILFMLLVSIWISLDAEKLQKWFITITPDPYKGEVDTLINRVLMTWNSYIRGEITLMIVVGSMVAVGNLLLGVRGALALGFFAGLMEVVPSLGPLLALIPGVLMALLEGSSHLPVDNVVFAVIVLLWYELVQVLENNLILPKVMGDAEDMHPAVVIVGIAIAGGLFGILGAVLTVPLLATLREIMRFLYAKILGEDPFLAEDEDEEGGSLTESAQRLALRARGLIPGQEASTGTPEITPNPAPD
jgi:predicted PurR-regulated permease PerM